MGYGEKVGTLYFDKGIIYYIILCLYNNIFISKFYQSPAKWKDAGEKSLKILSFFLKKDMKRLSIFTFRKIILIKKIHFSGVFIFLKTPYHACCYICVK